MATPQRTKAPAKTTKVEGSRAIPSTASAARAPSFDSIALRAYELWRKSGSAHGNDQAHWFEAERELRVTR